MPRGRPRKVSSVQEVREEASELVRTPEEGRKLADEANQKRINERLERMNAIADGADEQKEKDGMQLDELDEREAAAAREDEESQEYARQLQTEGAIEEEGTSDTGDTKTINGETYYLQIVNGKEKWQSLKEIRQTAQKIEAADEYLHQASESVRNASRAALSNDEPVRVNKDDLRKIIASAAMGDEDAIERLASVIDQGSLNPQALQQIDQRLAFRTELAQAESSQKEILEHPMLGKLFKARISELAQENPNMRISSAYQTVGEEIRKEFPEKFSQSKLSAKLERKKTLTNVPQAAARQGETSEEDLSEDDYNMSAIEAIARARNQSQAIKHAKH